jgi:hypothetical protein
MNIYKIYKENWSVLKRFDTIEEAQAYADSLGEGYSVEFVEEYIPISIEEKLILDLDFCTFITNRFIKENREASITEAESLELMQQFSNILSFAQVGAVDSVYSLLQQVTISRVYTQERKNKDLSDIQNYINNAF